MRRRRWLKITSLKQPVDFFKNSCLIISALKFPSILVEKDWDSTGNRFCFILFPFPLFADPKTNYKSYFKGFKPQLSEMSALCMMVCVLWKYCADSFTVLAHIFASLCLTLERGSLSSSQLFQKRDLGRYRRSVNA